MFHKNKKAGLPNLQATRLSFDKTRGFPSLPRNRFGFYSSGLDTFRANPKFDHYDFFNAASISSMIENTSGTSVISCTTSLSQ
jgi:hypothetical protein